MENKESEWIAVLDKEVCSKRRQKHSEPLANFFPATLCLLVPEILAKHGQFVSSS